MCRTRAQVRYDTETIYARDSFTSFGVPHEIREADDPLYIPKPEAKKRTRFVKTARFNVSGKIRNGQCAMKIPVESWMNKEERAMLRKHNNKISARESRERKKAQMEKLMRRVEELTDKCDRLKFVCSEMEEELEYKARLIDELQETIRQYAPPDASKACHGF